jgi:hypothetical protein
MFALRTDQFCSQGSKRKAGTVLHAVAVEYTQMVTERLSRYLGEPDTCGRPGLAGVSTMTVHHQRRTSANALIATCTLPYGILCEPKIPARSLRHCYEDPQQRH